MNFRPGRKTDVGSEINVTSFIDIVLLLLIFFMLATSFKRPTQMVLELPEAKGEAMQTHAKTLEIGISRKGEFMINGTALVNNLPETLKSAIIKASEGDRKIPLILSADANAPYQAVVTAMDSAGQAGFANITMATQKAIGSPQ